MKYTESKVNYQGAEWDEYRCPKCKVGFAKVIQKKDYIGNPLHNLRVARARQNGKEELTRAMRNR